MCTIEYQSDSLDDETIDCFIVEFLWIEQDKFIPCPSLKTIHKNWQEELKFAFDVS
jgi:hypothetical protein